MHTTKPPTWTHGKMRKHLVEWELIIEIKLNFKNVLFLGQLCFGTEISTLCAVNICNSLFHVIAWLMSIYSTRLYTSWEFRLPCYCSTYPQHLALFLIYSWHYVYFLSVWLNKNYNDKLFIYKRNPYVIFLRLLLKCTIPGWLITAEMYCLTVLVPKTIKSKDHYGHAPLEIFRGIFSCLFLIPGGLLAIFAIFWLVDA